MKGLPTRLRGLAIPLRGLTTRLPGRSHRSPAEPVIPPAPPATGPAGLESTDPAAPSDPGFRDRGRLRRRLRYLRRVRELGFRDLGGLVFDLHRFGRRGDDLVAQKLQALSAVDQELRALERVLADERPFHELHEPGLAACPRCAGIHGSDARYCPACGTTLRGPQAIAEVGDAGGAGSSTPASSPAAPAAGTTADPPAGPTPSPSDPVGPTPTQVAAAEQSTQAIPVVAPQPADASGGDAAAQDEAPADEQPTTIIPATDGEDADGAAGAKEPRSANEPS
jgi:hypothetical protein